MDGFERIVVGVDASSESEAAARWAAALATEDAGISLVAAAHTALAAHAGFESGVAAEQLVGDAKTALSRARAAVAGREVEERLVQGPPVNSLRHEAERTHAQLLAVGSHGAGRVEGIVVGSVTTALLHEAPCSVLVARPQSALPPRTIVAGVDGSDVSLQALEIARGLAERFGADLHVVGALGGKQVDEEHIRSGAPDAELRPGHPVEVLKDSAADADLLVVGSRGLHGLASLGSVSERAAHGATCSVLVVR